ncbi:hypothetical protein [Halopseudomonas oceani]|uniref:hypothetical protein n=1 Tax=Halopseudomonas oceani TaxID=1708783 RepID=UPI002AA6ED8D|nr:hypothetical protein [Halopseudomonas oceani]
MTRQEEMEKKSAEAAGLVLIDNLYQSQILVSLVFNENEIAWLKKISAHIKILTSLLDPPQKQASELEQWALTLLEVELFDGNPVNHKICQEIAPPSLDHIKNLIRTTYKSKEDLRKKIKEAMKQSNFPEKTVDQLLSQTKLLANMLGDAPATVRQRLSERIFCLEYPNALIEVSRLLIDGEVLKSTKSHTSTHAFESDNIAAAALVIAQVHAMRVNLTLHAELESFYLREILTDLAPLTIGQDDDARKNYLQLETALKTINSENKHTPHLLSINFPRTSSPQPAPLNPIPSKSDKGENLAQYFLSTKELTITTATLIKKPLQALPLSLALLAQVKKNKNPSRPLYSEEKQEDSIAHEVFREARELALEFSARGIEKYRSKKLQKHIKKLTIYHQLIKKTDSTGPTLFLDYYRLLCINHF